MSTTKPPAQSALDEFGKDDALPSPHKFPTLFCEVCGDSSSIIFSSDVATLCEHCASTIVKLSSYSIPTVLGALRTARRIHLMSFGGRLDRT